jgi:hypothetical protein
LDYPYDGSNQAKFDAVMGNLPANTTIHLLAGTYQTHGVLAYYLKSGQKVLGSGIDVTILQLASGTFRGYDGNYVLANQGGTLASNIEVCDLTCDCNYTPGISDTYHGVVLEGTYNAVRRVKVINQATYGGNLIASGIHLQNSVLPDSAGNIIEECEVSQYKGAEANGSIAAMSLSGAISGLIRNNRVFLTPSIGSAFVILWTHDLLLEGNYVDGVKCGIWSNVGGSTNMIIAHNTVNNCGEGVNLEAYQRRNITIAFNNFNLADGNSVGIQFNPYGPPVYCTNITIIGNNFSLKDQGTGTAYAFNIQNVSGLVCANNRIDASMTNYFSGCTGVNIYNNYDLIGNFLTNLNQLDSPNGVTRRTVTYSGTGICTNYVSYADKYLGVKGFSGTSTQEMDIFLPSAVGYPGKDFVVVDETGQANSTTKLIKIKPTSPNQINGATTYISITTPYTAKTAISDGTNWFAR